LVERAFLIGCGYTAAALGPRLRAEHVAAAGISLSGAAVEGVAVARADLRAGPLDLSAAAGAVVYYMVPTLADTDDGSHRGPMERVLAALDGQDVAGLIYLSSTSVYGDTGGGWVDERTPPSPSSPWGRMRADLEQIVWGYGRRRGRPACVVRLPEIYGPGRGPVERLRQGHAPRFPDRTSNRVHVDDLADVLLELGQRLDRELLLVCDGSPATTAEVYGHAAALLGQPPPSFGVEEEADPNRRALARDSKRCRNDELLRWLGRPLRYPSYRQGLAAALLGLH
jgi:nucleoside-diphosphate-sugar epimerase